MSEPVTYRVHDGVAVVSIANPPVNALSRNVRIGLSAALDRAEADGEVRAVVLRAEGQTFPAGSDIGDETASEGPTIPEICARLEEFPKPAVAALHGTVLGAGLELALAAQYRIALDTAVLGFPDVQLGLLPGAGGTQRLPRLTGAGPALDILLSGRPIKAAAAKEIGLVDAVVAEDLPGKAASLARHRAASDRPLRPTRNVRRGFKDGEGYLAAVVARREALRDLPVPAPAAIVDCVEAAILLPFEAGLEKERAALDDLRRSEAAAGLRHMFFAERRSARVAELVEGRPSEIKRVGILGAGRMGSAIAVVALDAGFEVTLVDRAVEPLEAGVERIIDIYDGAVARRRLTQEVRDQRMARLVGRIDLADLADADIVIEAVTEDDKVKRAAFGDLDAVMKQGAVLATNTSYLDIDALAAGTGRAGDVVGMHFFAPAHIMRLVEVAVGDMTTADTVATVFHLARRMGKIPVRSTAAEGFIGNRILAAYREAAEFMLEDGAGIEEIDAAMRAFGFPMGPFESQDLTGLDTSWGWRKRRAALRNPSARAISIADRLCELGRIGLRAGRGWYTYPEGARKGAVDDEVREVVAEERLFHGIEPRRFSTAEIQRRCLLAMANQGARLVEDGVALRPSDVDVVAVNGLGFPRWRGGPMQWAERSGLLLVKTDLDRFTREDSNFWEPSTLFSELIREGRGWDLLNA